MFGITFTGIFLAVAAIGWLAFDHILVWAMGLSGGLALITLLAPGLLLPLNRLWSLFAFKFGELNNGLILAIFFFLFMVPIGGIVRIFGKDPMMRKPDKNALSYWTPVNRHAEANTFADMF